MSNTEGKDERPDKTALAELESAVGILLERLVDATARADEAEARAAELDELVRRFTGDEAEAGRLLSRLKGLEGENTDLKHRLDAGREGVDRLLAKIRFLEEQK